MSGLGNSYELKALDAVFGDGRATGMPATVYLALFTATPSGAGGGTEVATGAYARPPVANNSTNFPNATSVSGIGTKKNGTQITFPQATASWGTPGFWAFFDALTAGSIVAWGIFTAPVAIASGETPIVLVGLLEIRVLETP